MWKQNRERTLYLWWREDARRLRRSAFADLASVTRLARRAAYSFYFYVSDGRGISIRITYSSILGLLRVATLKGDAVTLVLKTLWGDQTLDLRSLGVWLLALTLWLNLTTNDELANLKHEEKNCQHFWGICIALLTLPSHLQPEGCIARGQTLCQTDYRVSSCRVYWQAR